MYLRFLIKVTLVFIVVLMAPNVLAKQNGDLFQKPFSYAHYKICKQQLNSCPRVGPGYIAPNCLTHMTHNISCQQLQALAQTLQSNMSLISVTQYKSVYLITQNFPADGQKHYYLLSAQGNLIDTYPASRGMQAFIPVNTKPPKITFYNNGHIGFTFLIDLKPCIACNALIEKSKSYIFNAKGFLVTSNSK